MSHLLIIKDKDGKEIARVPVTPGWTLSEVRDPAKQPKPTTGAATKPVSASDGGKATDKVS